MLDRINYTQTHRDDLMVLMIRRTQQEVAVMEALAVIYTHTTRTKLADTLNAASVPSETGKPFSAADMTPIIKLLDRKGLAVWDGTKVACCGEIVEMLTRRMIAQGRFEPISQAVCEIYPVGLERLQWRMESPEDILRAFRIALYQNDVDFAFKLLDAMDAARVDFGLNAYHTICCNPFDAEWFANMHPVLQAEALLEIIVERSDYLEPLGDYLQRAEAILVEGQPEGFIPLRFVYAQTQILCGQWASACETASGLDQKNGTILAAWMDFLVGNNEQAIRGFEAAIKLIRKETGRRNIYISGPQGIAFILALVKDGRPKSLTRAAQLVKFARNEPGQWFALAYEILERVVKLRSGDPDGLLHGGYACWSASDTQHPMTILLREMLTYWQGDKICDLKRLGELHSGATAGGYRWLAAEAGELMSRMDAKSSDLGSQAAEFRAETRTVSICETATRQEPWLRALEAMAQIGEIAPGGGPSKRTERLIWRIVMKDNNTVERIQPVLQKSTLKGWTRGRKVAIKRLHEESASLEYLTDHDRKVCGAIQVEYDSDGYSYYGPREVFAFDTCKALLALVGHPQVFWDQGDTQIDVVSSRPELQVLQNDKSLHVSLTPSMTNRHGQTLDFVATQESPTRLAVITFSPEHRRIAALVGPDGIDVPNRGKDVLLKAIAAASASVTVQSDIGVGHEHEHVENIEPCPTPHVQLYPYGDGLKAAIAVRPFGDRGPYYSAKSGGQTVLAEVDGKRLQTTRDFVSEAKGVADLRLACDTLDRFDDLGGEYFSTDIEVCLQLLLELGQLGGQVIVEWPQGERFKIARTVSAGQFRMGIQKSKDWFLASGELQIDDSRVLNMRELLELTAESSGKFIPLGQGRFLALTVEFRKRLDELRTFGELSGDGVKMHPLTAPMLEELAAEVGACKTDKHWKTHIRRLGEARDLKPKVPSTFQGELRDYQVTGFEWMVRLAHWGVGACLADDMGLGKTIQALAVILTRAADGPTLVIAPTSVGANWIREAARFAPTLNVIRFGDGDRKEVIESAGPFDLIVCTYGLLALESEMLCQRSWETIVLDEAQAIKNMATKRSKAAMELSGGFKLITTGTPIENHLGELWNQFRFINPGLLGSIKSFNNRFAAPIERDRDKSVGKKLRRLIHPFILRRTKNQVLDELPPRTEIMMQVELSDDEASMYEALRRAAVDKLAAGGVQANEQRFQIFAEIMKLRRMCCNPKLVAPKTKITGSKLEVFGEVLSELLDNRHKALVFSQFVDHLAIIRKYLEANGVTYQYLDGSTTVKQRQKRIDAFQAGEGDVFLISLRAGGLGLNLTAADYVIHMDPWWNPAVEDQASDRAHRIGQQRPVTVYRLVTTGTIEEKIVELHHRKRHLADSLLEGADMSGKLSADDLLRLLRDA